jgi:hypothetical protein
MVCGDSVTMKECWQHFWPEVVNDFKRFPVAEKEISEFMKLAKETGGKWFGDVKDREVDLLLESHYQKSMNE